MMILKADTKVAKEVRFVAITDPRGEDYGFGLYYVPGDVRWILTSNAGIYCTSENIDPEIRIHEPKLAEEVEALIALGIGNPITAPEEGVGLDEAAELMVEWGWIEVPTSPAPRPADEKIRIQYSSGPSRYSEDAIDYMLAIVPADEDEEDVELYAEMVNPTWNGEQGEFDDETATYNGLRTEIILQAAEHGIERKRLEFRFDEDEEETKMKAGRLSATRVIDGNYDVFRFTVEDEETLLVKAEIEIPAAKFMAILDELPAILTQPCKYGVAKANR